MEILEQVQQLNVTVPSVERFIDLGDATALKSTADGTFARSNYERGILLYALVAHFRPTTVMEFGTGRGYGTLCMAWAMEDCQIPGTIYTVDYLRPDSKISWAIQWKNENPVVENLSWNEVWPEIAPQSWRDHIQHLTGKSLDALQGYSGPPIDFAFIDGGHGYDAVRHDLYATLLRAASKFHILLDDYEEAGKYGVSKLIKEEVIPNFEARFFTTYDRGLTDWKEAHNRDYQMVWVSSDSLAKPLSETYNLTTLRSQIVRYRYQSQLQKWVSSWRSRISRMRPQSDDKRTP